MTGFDALIIIVILISTLLAAARGALLELATLIALAIAAFITFKIASPVQSYFGSGDSIITTLLTYGLLITGIFMILYIIIHIIHLKTPLSSRGKLINKTVGGILGAVRGYILIGLGFLAYGYYLEEENQHESVRNAKTRAFAASSAKIFERFIPESTTLNLPEKATSIVPDDAAANGYKRSERAGLSEVITTVTTQDNPAQNTGKALQQGNQQQTNDGNDRENNNE